MPSTPTAAPAPGGDFVISRTFAAPSELLFSAFTEPDRMQRWWGPKGFTVAAASMDLRPGGTYHYGLRSPQGQEMWGKFVYREIVRPERIVWVNAFSDRQGGLTRHPLSPTWPLQLLTTLTLAEEGPSRTRLTITWSPIDPTPEERATFDAGHASMRGGWGGTLDQLAAYLVTG